MNTPSYYDLEEDDDEVHMSISLAQLARVCSSVGIRITDLFAEDSPVKQSIGLVDLANTLMTHLEQRKIPQSQFEKEVGWRLEAFLSDPKVGEEWNVDCLIAVCSPLNVDWKAVCSSIES